MGNLREQLAKQLGVSVEEFEAEMAKSKEEGRVAARRAAEEAYAVEHAGKAPRYLEAEPLTLADTRELLAKISPPPPNPAVHGIFDPATFTLPSVQRIRGSVTVENLRLPAEGSNLIIEGDLSVSGILKQDFRAGHLLVTGDLRATHVVTTGEIACLGNLVVPGVLYGNCTNYATNVWSKAVVGTLISAKEHYFCFWGGQEIGLLIDVYGDTPNLAARTHTDATMADVLAPEIGDAFDETVVFELLQARGTVLA